MNCRKIPIVPPLHVVLGAGHVGRTLAKTLFDQGATVQLVSRSGKVAHVPAKTDVRAADLAHAKQASAAVDGAAIVYHCAAPAYQSWVKEFPALQDRIVSATSQVGTRLVVCEITDWPIRRDSSDRGFVAMCFAN